MVASLRIDWRKGSPRVAPAFYMTLERIQETTALKGAPLSPLLRSLSGTLCMISQQRSVSHRTSKYSSNRHRKLQPFRETWRSCRSRETLLIENLSAESTTTTTEISVYASSLVKDNRCSKQFERIKFYRSLPKQTPPTHIWISSIIAQLSQLEPAREFSSLNVSRRKENIINIQMLLIPTVVPQIGDGDLITLIGNIVVKHNRCKLSQRQCAFTTPHHQQHQMNSACEQGC